MASVDDAVTREAQIRAVMEELGVSWEAAALLVAVESGDAMVDDVVFDPAVHERDRVLVGVGPGSKEQVVETGHQARARDKRA